MPAVALTPNGHAKAPQPHVGPTISCLRTFCLCNVPLRSLDLPSSDSYHIQHFPLRLQIYAQTTILPSSSFPFLVFSSLPLYSLYTPLSLSVSHSLLSSHATQLIDVIHHRSAISVQGLGLLVQPESDTMGVLLSPRREEEW